MPATPILLGLVLALGAALYARLTGLDRDGHGRAFYTTVLVVVATYYALFTVVAGAAAGWQSDWWRTLAVESIAVAAFFILAAVGFNRGQWIIVTGLAGHGVYDFFLHHHLIDNPGVPTWWPAFCGSYDITAAACLAWLTKAKARAGASLP